MSPPRTQGLPHVALAVAGLLLAATPRPAAAATPTIASSSQACGAPTTASLVFSVAMDRASAETARNYAVSGTTVTAARLEADQRTVTLTLGSPLTSRQTVTVDNVRDRDGDPIASGTTTAVNPATTIPGLVGTYFAQGGNRGASWAFTGNQVQRVDAQVNFDWVRGTTGVAGIPADGFSVRWTGFIKVGSSGPHGFSTRTDDGVRLWVNGVQLLSVWRDSAAFVTTGSPQLNLVAGDAVPVTMEFYENAGEAVAQLRWQPPGVPSSTWNAIPAANLFNCTGTTTPTSFAVTPDSTSASTCAASTVGIEARDSGGAVIAGYTGTITLSTSSGRGTWALGSGPAPTGTLVAGSNNGAATYTFAAGDRGAVRLSLTHELAQNVTVTATDGTRSASGSAIQFRDNAFVFAEDLSARVAGSNVAVAGRPHDFTISLVRRDPSTGSCGPATSYSGSRSLKFWRTDTGGSFTAPSVVTPVLSVPSAQPASNNLTLAFTAGVASFNLGSSDIGRYALNALDDSLSLAATAVSGSSSVLTVRPFALLVQGLQHGSVANPSASTETGAVFAPAGANFTATVSAQLWSAAMLANGADASNTGTPAVLASLAALTSAGRANSFASDVRLAALAGSQTPAGGTLGTLSNGNIPASAFSNGAATVNTLQYSEVGSFQIATSSAVTNFLGSGMALDAVAFNGAGAQSARVGRFRPAGFVLSAGSVTHRSLASCPVPSAFTYLGENFLLSFTLTAQNAQGARTNNYTGTFAKLDPANANWNLAGRDAATVFTVASTRLSVGSATGSFSSGVATGITLTANAARASAPDGPFNAAFGIAPVDSDGVAMAAFDMASTTGGGNDRAQVASVPLRFGRLRLGSATGAADRALVLPVAAQHWTGSAFDTNTLDSCTAIAPAAMSFGNLRGTLTTADTAASGGIALAAGLGTLRLAAPGGGRSGTYDVVLSLGSSATDASCLPGWTPGVGDTATAGANLAHLRGNFCASTYSNDPAARATFGRQRGVDSLVYRRENF